MDYSEVKLRVHVKDVETAAAIANMVVPYGLYIEDYSDIEELAPQIAHVDLIEQELLERDREHAVVHFYIAPEENPGEAISFVQERLDAQGIGYAVELEKVREEDWATAWKQYYHPTKVGERLVVVPSWETYKKSQNEVILTIDPGMAFGTGTHDTTRLCLQMLEKFVNTDTVLLDIGTGSGILAIASVLLGAKSALGVDIDEVAVRVARENAKENGVGIQFVSGDLVKSVKGKYSLITANIVADVIIRLLPDLDQYLDEDGVFLASGIIDARKGDVEQALAENGFHVTSCLEAGGWVAFSAKRTK